MAETNARLNVLIALKSVVQDGERGLQWIAKYGAALATTAATMAVFAAKQGLDLGGRITDLSNQADMGSDAFQVLALTALDSGVAMDEVSASAAKLRQNIQAARGGNEAMVASLAALHLTAAGLQALAPERQWELIAQRIAGATDRQAALNAAADLFGAKNAPKLMEVLQRLGVEGYDKLAQSTEKIRLSKEQLQTLDDAGDKLGRIVESLKYIAAKGTVHLLDGKGLGGAAGLIEQTFNDNQIERAKALIKIWRDQGNEAMAKNWEENLARLQATTAADPYAERNAGAQAAAAAADAKKRQAAYDEADADAVFEKWLSDYNARKKAEDDLDWATAEANRKRLAEEIAQGNAIYLANEEAKRTLAIKEAELALDRQLRVGREAMARLDANPHVLNDTRRQANLLASQNDLKLIAARRAQLEAERATATPERTGQIDSQLDSLSSQTASAQLSVDANTARGAGYGAMSGLVEYLNSVPDAAARAQQAVLGIAQAMEQGIATSLRGLIDGTMTWGAALQNIGTSVINAVIGAFVNMAAQWIVQQIVMAVAGNAIRAAQTAALLPITAAMTAMWLPAATAASIATLGGAAVDGTVAAHTAIYASAAGFAKGGPVNGAGTGTSDDIPAWLSNGEYVMPAAETARYRPILDAMRAGTLTPAGIGDGIIAAPAQGGGSAPVNISLATFDSRVSAERWARSSEGEAYLLNFMQRNIHKVSARA